MEWNKEESINGVEFSTQTPSNYYPPAVVNIRFHKDVAATTEELHEIAVSAIKQVEKNFSLQESSIKTMKKVQYQALHGYEVTFRAKVAGETQDIKLLIAKSPSGKMISSMVLTLPNKLSHVQPALMAMMILRLRKSIRSGCKVRGGSRQKI